MNSSGHALLAIADVKASGVGLEIQKNLTEAQWRKTGDGLAQCDGALQWWVGDWANYGDCWAFLNVCRAIAS